MREGRHRRDVVQSERDGRNTGAFLQMLTFVISGF
jgi:hypothetical protein